MATRSLGFSLTVKNSGQTEQQIDKINQKLIEVAKQIKAIKSTPISLSTNFDTKSINEFLKVLEKVKTAKLNPEIVKDFNKLKAELIELRSELKTSQTELAKLKTPSINSSEIEKVNGSLDRMNGHAKESAVLVGKLRTSFQGIDNSNLLDLAKSLNSVDDALKKVKDQKLVIKADKSISDDNKKLIFDSLKNEELELLAIQKDLRKNAAQVSKEFINQANNIPDDSIVGLTTKLSKLTAEYNKLSKAELEAGKGQRIAAEINKIGNEVSEREQAIGNFRRNVGNYQGAINSLIPTLEKLQQEGKVSQTELISIFKQETIARANQLENEIKQLSQEFRDLGTSVENAGKRGVVLDKLTSATRELATISSSTNKIGNDFQRLQGKLLGVSDIITGGLIGGGILATLGTLKSFGSAALTEFTQAETAIAKINQQLIVTGNSSGKSADELANVAKELEVLTGIDGDQILNDVTSSLLKFGSVQGQIFERAQKAALDLAATLGGDLKGAADLVGKALEDPEKGLTRLARAGVILDKATQETVKTAIKQNDLYKAQTIILKALEGKFGDVSNAIQNTQLEGLRSLTVAFNNFKEAIGGTFIRLLNDLLQGFKDLSLGINLFTTENKDLKRGIAELEQAAQAEIYAINGTIEALKDENFNREAKTKLIADLVSKYPELINQLDLEYASKQGLIEIEKLLTATVIDQTAKRIEAKKREDIIAKQLDAVGDLARIQRGDLTFGEKFSQGITKSNIIEIKKKEIEDYKRELDLLPKQFEDATKKLKQINNVTGEEIRSSTELIKSGIESVIKEATKIASNTELPKAARDTATKLKAEFESNKVKINIDAASKGELDNLSQQIKSAQNTLIGFRNTASQKIKPSVDTEDLEKGVKKIEDQKKRIQELKEQIEGIRIEQIANDFDKQIEKVNANTKRQIAKLQEELDTLQVKAIKSPNDLTQIDLINDLVLKLNLEANNQIDDINQNRNKALSEATQKLRETQREIVNIINQVSDTKLQIEIDDSTFGLEQAERKIKIQFESNLFDLETSLAAGLITQEQFDLKSTKLEADKLKEIEDLYDNHAKEYSKILQQKHDSERRLLLQTAEDRKQALITQLKLDNQQVNEDKSSGKITSIDAYNKVIENNAKAAAQIKEINTNLAKDLNDIDNKLAKNLADIKDTQVTNHRAAAKTMAEDTKKSTEAQKGYISKLKDYIKDNAKEILSQSFDLINQLGAALSEIDKNRSEESFEGSKSRLEKEYETRIKLAKGNASEITKLERERDQKVKELDRAQSKRRQDYAVSEAIIQGALAVIKSFATLGPIAGGIASAFIVGTTALQIIKIKSQKFAQGAYFNRGAQGGYTGGSQAPPDETGHRPIGFGVFHENEFMATAKQTTKAPWLYKVINNDRIKTNAGQPSTIEADLSQALRQRQAIHSLGKTIHKPNWTQVIPYIKPSTIITNKLELSPDQVVLMAEVMAEKIATKTGLEVFNGSKEGLKEATRETLRKESTLKRAAI